jgi:competence protein ComGC
MNPLADTNPRPGRTEQDAFTSADLLAVLGVVAVLALLTVTALAHNQPASDRAGCANNLRRLMLAWHMYADDHSGMLMAHAASAGNIPWISGFMDFNPGNTDNTNIFKLTNATFAAIGPYVDSSSLFRCPADPATVISGGAPKLRVRSYSMNEYVGLPTATWSPSYQVMTKMAEVSQPERIFVLLAEHPDSITGGQFAVDIERVGGVARIIDYPASFHFGGLNLGMADGHVDYWRWSDSRTMPPMNFNQNLALNVPSPNNPDVARLQAAASYRR